MKDFLYICILRIMGVKILSGHVANRIDGAFWTLHITYLGKEMPSQDKSLHSSAKTDLAVCY